MLALTSAAGGFAEAGMLVVIVQLALTVAQSGSQSSAVLPLVGTVSTDALFLLGLGLTVARVAFQATTAHLTARMSADVMIDTRKTLFSAFLTASWPAQAKERDGELQELACAHVEQTALSVQTAAMATAAVINVLSLVITAIIISWPTAVAGLLVGLLLFWLLRPMAKHGRALVDVRRQRGLDYAHQVASTVTVIMELHIFGVGKRVEKRLALAAEGVASAYYRSTVVSGLVPVVYQTTAMLLIIGILALLTHTSHGGVGSVAAAILILIRAISYGQLIQSTYHQYQGLVPYADGVRDAVQRYQEATEPTEGQAMPENCSFCFNHVSFAYVPGKPILSDISCMIERGELIGIAGPSGAGKSTFVQLLLRLRYPTKGAYLINGEPADAIALSDWFHKVAFVPQESRLIDGSIADNIRWFRDVTGDEIQDAAARASIHDEILELPEAYGTNVGDRGGRISGGQRQRISLARAFIGEPELVVLDEPTSALDVRSEQALQQTFEIARGTTTMVVIAHRLSTLKACDRLMILENGRVQAFDGPSALLSSSAFYRHMSEFALTDLKADSSARAAAQDAAD